MLLGLKRGFGDDDTLGPGWQEGWLQHGGDNCSEFGGSELNSLAHMGGEERNGI